MVELASAEADVSRLLLEVLRERYGTGPGLAEVVDEVPRFCRIGAQACHEAVSRRRANRLLTISILKDEAFGGKRVEIWSDHIRIPVEAVVRPHVVGH